TIVRITVNTFHATPSVTIRYHIPINRRRYKPTDCITQQIHTTFPTIPQSHCHGQATFPIPLRDFDHDIRTYSHNPSPRPSRHTDHCQVLHLFPINSGE